MANPLDLVQSYVLTAISSDPQDIMAAIENHFSLSPGFWQLKSSAANSVSIVIRPTTPFTDVVTAQPDCVIRRETSAWQVRVDPEGLITSPGTATIGSATSGTKASPELESFTPSGLSPFILVSELPDFVFILLVSSAKNSIPWGCGLGHGMDPSDGGMVQYGIDGHIAFSGSPRLLTSSAYDVWGSTTTDSSAVKLGHVQGQWLIPGTITTSPISAAFEPDGTGTGEVKLPIPMEVTTRIGSTTMSLGKAKYVREHPDAQPCFTRSEGVTQGWLHVGYSTNTTRMVIPWQRTVGINLTGA